MSSGWGPPASLKRSGVFYSGQGHALPLSPNTNSPAGSSTSAATPMPVPPPPHTTGIPPNDDVEYDDEEEDDDEDEDNLEDEEDQSQSFVSTFRHARPSSAAAADTQNRKRKLEQTGDDSLLRNTSQTHAGPSSSSNPAASGSGEDVPEKKPKVSRISKACTNCRRLKMRCVPSDKPGGHPCTRCLNSGGECLFSVSQRGKRTGKVKRNEAMVVSLKLKKMEETLNSVLRSIHDPTGSGGGALDAIASLPMSTYDSYSRTATDLPRSPFSNISPALPRVTASGSSSSAMASNPAGAIVAARASLPNPDLSAASPGGQHINPGALTSSGSYMYSQQNHSSSRSSHGGSQGAAFSPEHERGPLHGSTSRNGGGGVGGDASSASGSSHSHPSHLSHSQHRVPTKKSPRLHSLPDNALNPLGLLAEASLHNTERASRKAAAAIYHRRGNSFGSSSKEGESSMSSTGFAGRAVEGGEDAQDYSVNAEEGVQVPGESPNASKGGETGAAKAGASSSKVHVLLPDLGEEANEYRETADEPGADGEGTGSGGDDGTKTPKFVRAEGDMSKARGVASSTYFKPGPFNNLPLRRIIIEREVPPELLTKGIVSSEEVLDLFRIFFHNCATHVVLLDPDMHTPAFICARSPFLFSVVCSVASRYYTHKRPDLYGKCLAEAKRCAFNIMHRGYKSVEIVQGFLLLAMWNQPSERYETDQTWLFSGVAMRMATDLNLHRKSVFQLPPEVSPDDPAVLEREREILNRERTWFICFTIDRGLAAQMGKPYTIREDFLTRNCKYWCEQRASRPWDVGLSGLVELLRLTSRMLDTLYSSTRSVNGLNLELDYSTMLRIWNEQLEEFRDQWMFRGVFPNGGHLPADPFQDFKLRMAAHRAQRESFASAAAASVKKPNNAGVAEAGSTAAGAAEAAKNPEADAVPDGNTAAADGRKGDATSDAATTGMKHDERVIFFLTQQAPLRWFYVVLLINSFGLQRAVETQSDDKGYFFIKCLSSAKGMLKAAQTGLRPVLRYAPDAQFVMISYAAVFLLKLLRQFPDWVDEDDIIGRISNVIVLLDEVAVNETHTPANYATFLRRLLNARAETRPGSPYASAFPSRAHTPARPLSAHAPRPDSNAREAASGAVAAGSSSGPNPHLDGLAASLTSAAAGLSSHTFPATNHPHPTTASSAAALGLAAGLGGAASSSSLSGAPGASASTTTTTLGAGAAAGSNGMGAAGGQRRLSNFSPNIVSSMSQFGDENGGTFANAGFLMGGGNTADGFGTETSALNNPFAVLLGGGSGNGAFGSHLGGGGGGGGFGSNNAFDSSTFFFQGDGGSSGNMGNGIAMDEGMSAAAFGVSSLAQLFPSNLGFVGTAAPADSSHSAAFGLSGSNHGQSAHHHGGNGLGVTAPNGTGSGTANLGTSVSGAQSSSSGIGTAHQPQGGVTNAASSSIPVTAAANPAAQFTTQHNNNNGGGGHHQFGEGSLFDDNFWSTLLPPGFGGSTQPLLGPSWDFSSGSNFTSAGAAAAAAGGQPGGGVSASPSPWGAAGAGSGAGGSSRGGGGGGGGGGGTGANMTPSMSGNGGSGADGRSLRSSAATAPVPTPAPAAGSGASRGGRGSSPSAVGAFNF